MNDKERDALDLIVSYCDKAFAARDRHFPTKSAFDEDDFFGDGVAQYIMQIGECVRDLSESFMSTHEEIPWHQIRGMRNIIAHAYGSVDSDEAWHILQRIFLGCARTALDCSLKLMTSRSSAIKLFR